MWIALEMYIWLPRNHRRNPEWNVIQWPVFVIHHWFEMQSKIPKMSWRLYSTGNTKNKLPPRLFAEVWKMWKLLWNVNWNFPGKYYSTYWKQLNNLMRMSYRLSDKVNEHINVISWSTLVTNWAKFLKWKRCSIQNALPIACVINTLK